VGTTDKEVAVPSFRRRASATDADQTDTAKAAEGKTPDDAAEAPSALSLADEAEAEAAEAEALAAAASARARAVRLRREAEAAAAAEAEPADETATEADETADGTEAADDADATEATDEAPELIEQAEPTGRRWGLVLKIVAMTLGVLLTAGLIAASVYMVLQHRKVVEDQRMNAEYAAAGRQSVVTLMSLDFNKAQEDVQRIIDNATGEFKKDFQNQAEDFVKVAQDSKVITDVTVNSSAVDSMTKDSANVLVAATSRVTNAAGAKQEPRAWRLAVTLERDGDQIKMSKVEFVP
jgi:Mce-associated membrane protein